MRERRKFMKVVEWKQIKPNFEILCGIGLIMIFLRGLIHLPHIKGKKEVKK